MPRTRHGWRLQARVQIVSVASDIVNSATLISLFTRPWVEMQAQLGAPWTGTMDDPRGFVGQLGWEAEVTEGTGRVISDGVLHALIVDVIVLPSCRGTSSAFSYTLSVSLAIIYLSPYLPSLLPPVNLAQARSRVLATRL